MITSNYTESNYLDYNDLTKKLGGRLNCNFCSSTHALPRHHIHQNQLSTKPVCGKEGKGEAKNLQQNALFTSRQIMFSVLRNAVVTKNIKLEKETSNERLYYNNISINNKKEVTLSLLLLL